MKYFHLFRISLYMIGFLGLFSQGIEKVYAAIFNKPIFVHFYFRKRKLSKLQKKFLVTTVPFYRQLNKKHQQYFEHRLSVFIREYNFIGRESYIVNASTKVLIGATYVMLTFGMRRFLTDVFDKIIIYPKPFLSRITRKTHKGEFNPRFKIVVFSWQDFLNGIEITNDNRHLGIHEFTHVLSFHSKKSKDFSATVFYEQFKEITDCLSNKEAIDKIKKIGFFRNYAFANKLEFAAIVMECFFESPKELKHYFPELYQQVVKMLNYNILLKNY